MGDPGKEFGGLSARAKQRLEELAVEAEAWMPLGKRAFQGQTTSSPIPRVRDSRLPPPGTVLTRPYRGRTIAVTVLESGFEYEGQALRLAHGRREGDHGRPLERDAVLRLTGAEKVG